MPTRLLPKQVWKSAIGAKKKPKRLHLAPSEEGLYHCPVKSCDSCPYRSQRGCRKHVSKKHGWFYYFDERPSVGDVLPEQTVKKNALIKTKKSQTGTMPTFNKACNLHKSFKNWLISPGGSTKSKTQAEQISCRILKYMKFCCQDSDSNWEIPVQVADYCVGCITLLSDFVEYLKSDWSVGYSGIIGYMNAITHFLDYRRINMPIYSKSHTFTAAEIYIQRVKQSLAKKMRSEWNTLLSVDYLSSINCWASLEDLEKVIPFQRDKFAQIVMNCSTQEALVAPHDLSFCTSFITTVLFLMVKASRPMTYQFLTVAMIESIDNNGYIDQTVFKTSEKYGFDTLIFSTDVVDMINGYIKCVRPKLNPVCRYLLVTKNGTQSTRLGDIFGRMVFQAIGKYVHPTRYRQIIETESAEKLTIDEQNSISEDQKHTSNVARVHYKKLQSRTVAERGREAMAKLRDNTPSSTKLKDILTVAKPNNFDFKLTKEVDKSNTAYNQRVENQRKVKVPFSKQEDAFILSGIKRYGKKWTAILNDPEYSFNSSRTTATLLTRAKSCKFI